LRAWEAYKGSDAEVTRALYRDLASLGPQGMIALNLFRAQKSSERAKKYRGGIRGKGSYREMAYSRKNWSLEQLCMCLKANPVFTYGWKKDPGNEFYPWVLYVDLPTGQVSFHSFIRGEGPDYPGNWDHEKGMSPQRIISFCDSLLGNTELSRRLGVQE